MAIKLNGKMKYRDDCTKEFSGMMLLDLWSVSVLPGDLIHMNALVSAFPSSAAATSIS